MYMYYSHQWVLYHMDPLYSYSMGIAQRFPQSFLLYTITMYILLESTEVDFEIL